MLKHPNILMIMFSFSQNIGLTPCFDFFAKIMSIVKVQNQDIVKSKHRVANTCFDHFTKVTSVVKVASKLIKNGSRY